MGRRSVDPLEALRRGFANYIRFRGRARRSEYWWFFLMVWAGTVALAMVETEILGFDTEDGGPLTAVWILATFLPLLAVGWRRLHDIGRSGWWQMLPIGMMVWAVAAGVTMFSSDQDLTVVGVLVMIGGIMGSGLASVYVLYLMAMDSDPYTNRYGPSAKYAPAGGDVFAS